jgi:hypothetical protein
MFTIDPATREAHMAEITQEKYPRTWFIEDSDIIEAIWRREDEGFAVTRSQSLANALAETSNLADTEAGDAKLHRELERRMLELVREKKLAHDNGDYYLVEPPEDARYTLVIGGEKGRYPIDVAPFPATEASVWKLAEVLSDLTGFRREFLVATKLAFIQPGKKVSFKFGIGPIRFIVERKAT